MTADDGQQRVVFAQESPVNVFEDFGSAQLVKGAAEVTIESLFAQAVNTSQPYYVFVTPNGDCNGLFVSEKKPGSFVVKELKGGKSNLSFDYRIVAKRKGYETVRMAPLKTASSQQELQLVSPKGLDTLDKTVSALSVAGPETKPLPAPKAGSDALESKPLPVPPEEFAVPSKLP
jgi:hypothetical protein